MPPRPVPPSTLYREARRDGLNPRQARALVRRQYPTGAILPSPPRPAPPRPESERPADLSAFPQSKLEVTLIVTWHILKWLFWVTYVVMAVVFTILEWMFYVLAGFVAGFVVTQRMQRRD